MTIPNDFERARRGARMSQAELAERAGLARDWYEYIEAGRILPTYEELTRLCDALGGIAPEELYQAIYLHLMTTPSEGDGSRPSDYFRESADQSHMLVARDELTWLERHRKPDRAVDVFVNLSCSTQQVPHLLLDTVAVLEALDVSFVAAAGPIACCGKPFLRHLGRRDRFEQTSRRNLERGLAWGAKVHVNWCTACQITTTTAVSRRELCEGSTHPVSEVHVLAFIEDRLRELGDRVPWRHEIKRRVLVEGLPGVSPIHRDAQLAAARALERVPGVEVVGLYDGASADSPSVNGLSALGAEAVAADRQRLADTVRALGADTVCCQHQLSHARWSRYASDRLAVRHPISVVADALGCAHPDRHQAAVRLGDPQEFVRQTRTVWQSWGLDETRALELAAEICDPAFADPAVQCGCGSGSCDNGEATVDVLRGHVRRSRQLRQ
jgi:Fe-S oxidoreductase